MSNITRPVTKAALLVAVLIVTFSGTAQAQRHPGGVGVRVAPHWRLGLRFGPFYDPFWGPYYPYGVYPYVVEHPTAMVRVEGVPKQTEVFVDGYWAGTAGTFAAMPGGHAITLFLPGYRTITESIYVRPGSTFKMNETMARLGAGEVSTPPPSPVSPVER